MNWYAAKPNEIFLDIDSKKSLLRALRVIRLVLKRKDEHIENVYHYPTTRPGHSHLIIQLDSTAYERAQSRAMWALWMGSDRLRAVYVMMRIQHGMANHADLLVTAKTYHREPDDTCDCKGKHKGKVATDNCPALTRLLGDHRSADYFPRVGRKNLRGYLRVPVGRISKRTILRWENRQK